MNEDALKARLDKALEFGGRTHTMADLVMLLRRGEAQWFGNGSACVVAEVLTYPQAKMLNFWLVAGELQACLALQDEVDEFGLREGCTRAVATGRCGWLPALTARGWKLSAYRYTRALSHE